jgi:hypothetical protein
MTKWLLFLVFSVYFILDAWHTHLLLKVGLKEANPLMAWAIDLYPSYPFIPLVAIKIVLVVILGVLIKVSTTK